MPVDEAVAMLEARELEAVVAGPSHENYDMVRVESTVPAAGETVSWHGTVTVNPTIVTVTSVVDGITLDLSTGDRVRLIGVTTSADECAAAEAAARIAEWVGGAAPISVDNPLEVTNRDLEDHLLAYVSAPGRVNDLGYTLLAEGLAVPDASAGPHPMEALYAEGAAAAEPVTCAPAPDPAPPPQPIWSCSYAPTYDDDWHNDVACTDGATTHRPYLREWDSFITEDEIMESAAEYERQLNGQ